MFTVSMKLAAVCVIFRKGDMEYADKCAMRPSLLPQFTSLFFEINRCQSSPNTANLSHIFGDASLRDMRRDKPTDLSRIGKVGNDTSLLFM